MEIVSEKYQSWLGQQKQNYRASQIKAAVTVNSEMLKFYWSLGADIVRMEIDRPWGSKFLMRLSDDLRREMPEAKCFSAQKLKYIRHFYRLYAQRTIVPQVGEQLKCITTGISPQVGDQIGQQAIGELYYEDFNTKFPNVLRLILSEPWGHHKVLMDKFGDKRDDSIG